MEIKNELVNRVLASVYCASYMNAGGKIYGIPRKDNEGFLRWLRGLYVNHDSISEEGISKIYKFAQHWICDGNLELQSSAETFLKGI